MATADAPRYLGDLPHAGCRPGLFLIPAADFPPRGAALSDGNRGIKNDIGIHLYHKEKDVLLIQDLSYEQSSTHLLKVNGSCQRVRFSESGCLQNPALSLI